MLLSSTILIASYLLGSIPFGLLIVRSSRGIDVRKRGSGNIGTTNVLRSAGRKEACLTLLADVMKGFLPVFMVQAVLGDLRLTAAAGTSAVLGHIFPVFLKFRGGKGVATALGVLAYLLPKAALGAVLVFLALTYWSKYVSLGSITAAITVPILAMLFHDGTYPVCASMIIALLVIVRHSQNIRGLLAGEENKLGAEKTDQRRQRH